ncbi:MAG: sensor histidine kinase [Pirellulales bacterium]|nr:sensor histidine kinase [Pirellulales bacterium]
MASDIHDGMVQYITGAQMHLQAILETDLALSSHLRQEIKVSVSLLQKSIREARHLIRGLRPPVLDELGIVDAVQHLIDESPPGKPIIEFRRWGPFERLDPLLESSIFRIVQEALTNARRHSKADWIVVSMRRRDNMIQLEIRDSGIGFDSTHVPASCYGLHGMCERARLLGGRTIIETNLGEGTQVIVELPITRASGN